VLWGHHDPVLKLCLERLAGGSSSGVACAFTAEEETSRRLVLRLAELNGCGRPDWCSDSSVFDRRTMAHLVECIDEHIGCPPSLGDLAVLTGLSPSHFAKKFRESTGVSLGRSVNRRRIKASLDLLRNPSRQVAGLALDLGFSSQSHFTKVFAGLTGMTPAKYQRQFRGTVG